MALLVSPKNGKKPGPDDIPIEALKLKFLLRYFIPYLKKKSGTRRKYHGRKDTSKSSRKVTFFKPWHRLCISSTMLLHV